VREKNQYRSFVILQIQTDYLFAELAYKAHSQTFKAEDTDLDIWYRSMYLYLLSI